MSGFDCEFVVKPGDHLQTDCPVCLLILGEPYQVTCCGKSFCKECIGKIKARSQPCPNCRQDRFEFFFNKDLQQPLYGFAVFCSNKERGCVWEGELGQLDQHINSNPGKEKQLVGCVYTNLVCLFCGKLHPRYELKHHQTSLCPKRPFTCFMCEEYESTYEDVVNSHVPKCKCRPVECPNLCGADNLQHQHLEEHVSIQCPLTYVECEFSDAGCDVKVYRKDLASHLTDNLVTHMSLLAMENRKLKQQLQKQEEKADTENKTLQVQVQKQKELIQKLEIDALLDNRRHVERVSSLETQLQKLSNAVHGQDRSILNPPVRFPPFDLQCPIRFVYEERSWASEPVYIRVGTHQALVRLVVTFHLKNICKIAVDRVSQILPDVHPEFEVTVVLVDQSRSSRQHRTFQLKIGGGSCAGGFFMNFLRYSKDNQMVFCIADAKEV